VSKKRELKIKRSELKTKVIEKNQTYLTTGIIKITFMIVIHFMLQVGKNGLRIIEIIRKKILRKPKTKNQNSNYNGR